MHVNVPPTEMEKELLLSHKTQQSVNKHNIVHVTAVLTLQCKCLKGLITEVNKNFYFQTGFNSKKKG